MEEKNVGYQLAKTVVHKRMHAEHTGGALTTLQDMTENNQQEHPSPQGQKKFKARSLD